MSLDGYAASDSSKTRRVLESSELVAALWQRGELGAHSPRSLNLSVWAAVTLHCGVSSRSEHAQLCMRNLQLSHDEDGMEVVRFEPPSTSMTGARRLLRANPAATDEVQRCPVFLFKEFVRHRPVDCRVPDAPLYLQPKKDKELTGEVWFNNCGLGKNKIGSLLNGALMRMGLPDLKHLSMSWLESDECTLENLTAAAGEDLQTAMIVKSRKRVPQISKNTECIDFPSMVPMMRAVESERYRRTSSSPSCVSEQTMDDQDDSEEQEEAVDLSASSQLRAFAIHSTSKRNRDSSSCTDDSDEPLSPSKRSRPEDKGGVKSLVAGLSVPTRELLTTTIKQMMGPTLPPLPQASSTPEKRLPRPPLLESLLRQPPVPPLGLLNHLPPAAAAPLLALHTLSQQMDLSQLTFEEDEDDDDGDESSSTSSSKSNSSGLFDGLRIDLRRDECAPNRSVKLELKEVCEKVSRLLGEDAPPESPLFSDVLWSVGALGTHNWWIILFTLWWLIHKRFGVGSRMNHVSLKWQHIRLSRETNREFIEYVGPARWQTSKNAQVCRRVYEDPANPSRCFVRVYKTYMARRRKCTMMPDAPFYLQPLQPVSKSSGDKEAVLRDMLNEQAWYGESGLGKNRIGAMMRNILQKILKPQLNKLAALMNSGDLSNPPRLVPPPPLQPARSSVSSLSPPLLEVAPPLAQPQQTRDFLARLPAVPNPEDSSVVRSLDRCVSAAATWQGEDFPGVVERLWNSCELGSGSPCALNFTFWFINTICFGVESRTQHLCLRWGDFQLANLSDGRPVILYRGQRTLYLSADLERPQRCPVRLLRAMERHRPPAALGAGHRFYLQPRAVAHAGEDMPWFTDQGWGKNKLGALATEVAVRLHLPLDWLKKRGPGGRRSLPRRRMVKSAHVVTSAPSEEPEVSEEEPEPAWLSAQVGAVMTVLPPPLAAAPVVSSSTVILTEEMMHRAAVEDIPAASAETFYPEFQKYQSLTSSSLLNTPPPTE